MRLRPLQDRVLIKRVAEDERTAGGIIIPDTAKEKPAEGEVVAAGPGYVQKDGSVRELELKQGDRVLFGKFSGSDVDIDGEIHLIMREADVLAVIEKAKKKKKK
ncbi:MAG: co-chaperone GroES [Myxococcales bacterium]|nr:co-chaperone GroES [Myxococcales bacterium]